MKRSIPISSIIVFLVIAFLDTAMAQTRSKFNFGFDWQFRRSENPDTGWEKVTIPHTARIEDLVVKNQYQGRFIYQKSFIPEQSPGQKTFLYFEGVMMNTRLYFNGKNIATHMGGYLPFTVDISQYIKPGRQNTVRLEVTNTDDPTVPPGKPLKELDFNFYGGIYRNVYLIRTDKLYITDAVAANKKGSGGVTIHFEKVSSQEASGYIQTHIRNDYPIAKRFKVKAMLTDQGKSVTHTTSGEIILNPNKDTLITQQIRIIKPWLWSVDEPNLYTVEVCILENGQYADKQVFKTGIRQAEIREDGFYLNGKKEYLSGTNRHQEYPYIGYALSDEAQFRDAVKIKNAGFNFVRLSHYPQAEAFLNACDELGITVMNSLAGWQFFGNPAFQSNSLQQLRDMCRRDRNHPSIVFWENSLNETEMTDSFMKQANTVLREEFPLGKPISASWMDKEDYDLFIPARQHAKAPDYWTTYNKPGRKIFIAEYGDWEYYAQNAGFNQLSYANLKEEERTSRQLRAFGEKRLLQQAFNFQEASNSNRKGNNTIGEANWLMFDYNRGYSPDIESSGISDIFRIPKFSYYFYQSQRPTAYHQWLKTSSGAMVSIASYWNERSPLDVTVYSNCEEVALYLNDSLIGRKKADRNQFNDRLAHPPFVFPVAAFKPGILKAVGIINNQELKETVIRTPGKASAIGLSYDHSGVDINRHHPDMVFVYARINDDQGTLVPDADNQVQFTLEGTDADLIGQNPIRAEAGIATIILRTNKLTKPLTVTARSNGLPPSILTIQ